MLAKELIDRIESRGLLDQEIIEALREQLDQGGTRVTPEAVAKLLVDNGQLTRFQATKLIGELRSEQYSDDEAEEAVVVVDDGLTIADEFGDAEVAEAVEAVEVVAEAEPVAEVAEAVAVEAMPVDAVGVEAVEAVAVEAMPASAEPVRRTPRPQPEEVKSTWDSFKIYGYLGIIGFLALAGTLLVLWLNQKNADEVIEQANKLYDQQNYTNAQDQYIGFLGNFGENNQYSSISRTRITMCELYRALTVSDTTRALDLAKEKLPSIEEEEGLNEERGNLAALLVDISDNIATAAGKATETTEKEQLLSRLDESIEFMANPMYMTGSMRNTLSGRINSVLEAQAKVRRDINRNKSLDATVANMESLLKEEKTKEAYDARFELLRDFPELETNDRLVTLIQSACDIQQKLVTSSDQLPSVAAGATQQDSLKSIVLTAQKGPPVLGLRDQVFYLRAQGSVLGIGAGDGKLLWRRFVGYGQDHSPTRLEGLGGVLLSDSASYEIQRCDGKSGKVLWRSKVSDDFSQPLVVRDDIFCSRRSGVAFALDIETGESKWATAIPQPLEVSPGVDARTGRAYLPGDHSNLYVLDSRNGSSLQSHYIGHAKGTIAVPPVPLLGHVFVIENAGPDFCRVHILRTDDKGNNLKRAQDPVRMTGNVRVSPTIVQQRRLIVLTDLGQVTVLDVEPTAEGEQVSVVANQVASYNKPTETQMAVGKSQMWITGSRIGRYELQINTGRVVQDWFKHAADTFVGKPLASPDALIHARVLRGTTGIRVAACDPKTGDEFWRTDVGVPISMLTKSANGFHAINSQGALFELTRESLTLGVTQNPIENPGGEGVAMRFEEPVRVKENVFALLNQETPGQIILYDPSRAREKLRLVTLGLPDGAPSGGGLGSGDGLFMGLDTGRAVLMNYQTGRSLGNPFQPPSSPSARVTWSSPVALPSDPNQVVIGDSRKKIYRLRVGDQIRDLSSKGLKKPFLGRTTVVGDKMFATVGGPDADSLVAHELSSLNEVVNVKLAGRVAWGPFAAGDLCLLKTEDSNLRGFDDGGNEKFSIQIPAGQPIGKPIVVGNKVVLAGKTGWLISVDPSSGQLIGQADLGQPISATPYAAGSQLLVPGSEGVVYVSPIPGA